MKTKMSKRTAAEEIAKTVSSTTKDNQQILLRGLDGNTRKRVIKILNSK